MNYEIISVLMETTNSKANLARILLLSVFPCYVCALPPTRCSRFHLLWPSSHVGWLLRLAFLRLPFRKGGSGPGIVILPATPASYYGPYLLYHIVQLNNSGRGWLVTSVHILSRIHSPQRGTPFLKWNHLKLSK